MKDLINSIKIFYKFVFIRKYVFVLFMLATTVSIIVSFISPYFFKLFVESIESKHFESLINILLVYLGVLFIGLIFSNLKYFLGDIVSVDASIALRTYVFKYVQDLDFAFHANKSTGSLISAFKRGDHAFFGLFEKVHMQAWEIIIGFILMIVLFAHLDPRILGIFVVSFLVTLIVTRYLAVYNVRTRQEFNEWEDKVSGIITDNLINYETVKLFARENWEMNRLKDTFIKWKYYVWRHFWTYRMIDFSVGTLVNIGIFAVLFLSLNLISKGLITTGDFVLIITFIGMFFPKLFDLIYGFRDISINYADIQKYFGILSYPIQIEDPQTPIQKEFVRGEINFDNVSFSYKESKKNAVSAIGLTVRQGQSVALVGRSGSGKTTLIKLLMRFYDVDKGKITIDGINIDDFTKSNLRSFMGVVPQEPILFNETIGYNIGYGKEKASEEEIKAAAKLANIHEFIDGLPKKYNTQVGERGIKLSGGQKQRLAIARMILSDPDIIIFDEATSQLDSENERLIQDAFWRVARDKTTIIIAHRLSTAMRADKIIVFEKGKIIEEGSHLFLLSKKESLYKHFWDLQTSIE